MGQTRDLEIGRYEVDGLTDVTHIKVDLEFETAKTNIFSGNREGSGYRLTFAPIAVTEGRGFQHLIGDSRGMRVLVVASPRFSQNRMVELADTFDRHGEVLALLVATADGDKTRLHAVADLARRIAADTVTDEDKRTMVEAVNAAQQAHAAADPHCTCNDCIKDADEKLVYGFRENAQPGGTGAATMTEIVESVQGVGLAAAMGEPVANEVVAWIADTGVGADPLLIFCHREACVETAEKACKAGVSPQAVTRAEADESAESNRESILCERCEELIALYEPPSDEDRERDDDDGREYADPRDEMERRLLID